MDCCKRWDLVMDVRGRRGGVRAVRGGDYRGERKQWQGLAVASFGEQWGAVVRDCEQWGALVKSGVQECAGGRQAWAAVGCREQISKTF